MHFTGDPSKENHLEAKIDALQGQRQQKNFEGALADNYLDSRYCTTKKPVFPHGTGLPVGGGFSTSGTGIGA